MVRMTLRAMLAVLALGSLASLVPATAEGAHPDIFYNFYNGPSATGAGVPAQMYIAPLPTPPLVGHTYISYPPLMPHEFMYHHHRAYYKYYRNGGWVSANVHYH